MLMDDRQKALSIAILRGAVAAYLIYLGYSLIKDQLAGNSTMAPWLSWVSGVLFILAGAGFIWYSWKRYRADSAESPDGQASDAAKEPHETE